MSAWGVGHDLIIYKLLLACVCNAQRYEKHRTMSINGKLLVNNNLKLIIGCCCCCRESKIMAILVCIKGLVLVCDPFIQG